MALSLGQVVLERMLKQEEKLLEKGEAISGRVFIGMVVSTQP